MRNFLPALCLFVLYQHHLPVVQTQSAEIVSTLLKDIIKLDERARPVKNFATVTLVDIEFYLLAISHFDTVNQKLISTGWLKLYWVNEYTTWIPQHYDNIYMTTPDPSKVWRPKIALYNTMSDIRPVGENHATLLTFFNGSTIWAPAERFESFCQVDVTYFPFDTQVCTWIWIVWGMDPPDKVVLQPLNEKITLQTYMTNGEWELRATRMWREKRKFDGVEIHQVVSQITLRRRSTMLALTVILPVMALAVINVYVFTIPSEAGERLAYSMTSLLSFGVFMSFIVDSIPSAAETLSIIAVYISCLLILSALYVLLCIMTLQLFHRDSVKNPVPKAVQIIIVRLEILVCIDPPVKNKVSGTMHVGLSPAADLASTDFFPIQKEAEVSANKGHSRWAQWVAARKKTHSAYMDPSEMTWPRVSRTVDKLLFRFFFSVMIVSNVGVWIALTYQYN